MDINTQQVSIPVSSSSGSVSAEWMMPASAKAILVLAHGAGAGMKHRFMVALSGALAQRGIGTLRYNFPYMEQGRKMPDPPAIAEKTVAMMINTAVSQYPRIPLFAGGKSFGGRMTSQHLSKTSSSPVKGIIFYGFPLHPENKPDVTRAAHLSQVRMPMLFLQGTHDKLAELSLIQKVCGDLATAALELFEKADHSFKAGKHELIDDLAHSTEQWVDKLVVSKKS